MTYLGEGAEREADARFDAHQERLADEADQRARLGFEVGDMVTVGNGKKVWRITSFWVASATGEMLAALALDDGYTHTSVEVDRLRAVP